MSDLGEFFIGFIGWFVVNGGYIYLYSVLVDANDTGCSFCWPITILNIVFFGVIPIRLERFDIITGAVFAFFAFLMLVGAGSWLCILFMLI